MRGPALGGAIERKVEVLAADEFTVRDAAGFASCYDAVVDGELVRGRAESNGGEIQEGFAGGGCGLGEALGVEVCGSGLAAGRGALIRRDGGVALDELD